MLVLGQASIRMSRYLLAERRDDDLLKHLLRVRGVEEKDESKFLKPDWDEHRHDPFLLHDMDKAVDRVLEAVRNKEHIAIYSDYDCDGIPGAVVLHDFFKAIGHTNFSNHIPHRHYDGFGLSETAVEKMCEAGARIIITIDCGTADVAAARRAAALGVDLIITDHHEPKEELPEAVAVVNPRIGDSYPFPHLCGAAVVFKLAEALIARGKFSIKPGAEKWWLDMVGLATIGDMVPLQGENRVFARYGLTVLRKSRRPGLQQLLRTARANQAHLTEDDIGFTIAPRINAASRMDAPEDAFLLLSAREEGEAGARAAHLERLNRERKGIVAAMTKELKRRVSEMVELPDVLVLGSPEWRPALAGLAANGLAETYSRPAFVWGRDGNGVIKGSCRSEGNTSVVSLMNAAAHMFVEHGGHHMSGGFSVREDQVFSFGEELNAAYKKLGDSFAISEPIIIDASITLEQIDSYLHKALAELAPFGVGNPKPLFEFRNVTPKSVDAFGKAKEHLKLIFESQGHQLEAIAFFAGPDSFANSPEPDKPHTLLAHVEESFFMNRRQRRLRIVDIL